METIILLFVGFVAWLYLAKFINDNYQNSKGWSSLFWLILLFGTFSFLFGSSNSGSSGSSSGGGGNNDYYDDEDDCTKSWFDNDYDSCDSSSSFDSFDDE